MDVLIVVGVSMLIGFFVGYTSKGINITVIKKEPTPIPQSEIKYNESTASELPKEVKEFYDRTEGFMNL